MGMDAIPNTGPRRRPLVAVLGAALLLIFAATLKTWQYARMPDAALGGATPRTYAALLVALEMGVAAWLISGIARKVARLSGALLFAVFALFAGGKAVSGAVSCGCFGFWEVDPRATVALDIVVGFGLWRAARCGPAPMGGQQSVCFWLGLALGLCLAIPVLRGPTTTASPPNGSAADAPVARADGVIVLDPAGWSGKRLPLHGDIPWPKSVESGKAVVIFYHHDCDDCVRLMPRLAEETLFPTVLVAVPPHGAGQEWRVPNLISHLRLDPSREWFVRTPLLLRLEDGIIIEVKVGEQLKAELERQAKQ